MEPAVLPEVALLVYLKQTGQVPRDVELEHLIEWACACGVNYDELQHIGNEGLAMYEQKQAFLQSAPPFGEPDRVFHTAQSAHDTIESTRTRDENNTNKEHGFDADRLDKPISAPELALLAHLQATRELLPYADLQILLNWGRTHGLNNREALRAAGERLIRGELIIEPEAYGEHPPPNNGTKELNWVTSALDMLPSELGILTHLQFTGELSTNANLQDLLEWGHRHGMKRKDLRQAGNRIRFGEPSESQEAYRERLELMARRGADAMRKVLDMETPGVDGERTAAIEGINHFEVGGGADKGPEAGRQYWRQTSTRDEDLDDYRYPSIFARSRLDNPASNVVGDVDESVAPFESECSNVGGEHSFSSPAAPRMADDQIINGGPVPLPSAWQDQKSFVAQYPQAVRLCGTGDYYARTNDKLAAPLSPSPPRGVDLQEYPGPDNFALSQQRGMYSRRFEADNMAAFKHDLAPDLKDLEGGIVFNQYEGELDLQARLRMTNGELLDDMEIDGV